MFLSIARLVSVLKHCRGENLEDRLMELKRAAKLSEVTEKIIVVNLVKHLLVPIIWACRFGERLWESSGASRDVGTRCNNN